MIKILGIILSLALSSNSYAQSQDELKIGLSQEFESLNQLITTMLASQYIYAMAGRTLVVLDAEGKWVTQLAENIPTFDNKGAEIVEVNGKKKIRAHWNIIEKAKWSDGTPVTCADFKLSLDVANTSTVAVSTKEEYTIIDTITWDEKTPKRCVFTYQELRWDYYQIGRFVPLPSHLETAIFSKFKTEKEGYEKNTLYVKNPTQDGLYNGPYKITEVKPGSHVVLVPNPYFYGETPYFKKIVVKFITNTGTLEANLLAGGIDLAGVMGFTLDQAIDLEKRLKTIKPDSQVVFKPSLSYEHIDLDLENPLLSDLKVRKALIYAIDRENLVRTVFDDRQLVALHPISPIDPWYTNDPKKITLYKYDRRKAKKLLDEAGWKLNKEDGIRYKDGKKLSFKFMTTAGNKSRETVQVYLQNQWKEIGVEVLIKNEPARVFFGETLKKRTFGGMAMFAWIVFPERTQRPFLHSDSIPTEKNGWAGRNTISWKNKKVDSLIDKIESEFNSKKRKKMAHEMLALFTQEIPSIPLFNRTDASVIPRKLLNYKMTGSMFMETNEIEKWKLAQ